MKSSKFYYICGALLTVVAAAIAIVGMTLPSAVPEYAQVMGWIGLGVVVLAIVLFFFGIYLVKKGNFVKLNKVNNDAKDLDKKFEESLEDKYKDQ
ncbi:MAG: hypothetical protein J6X03_02705 [Bacilli bacterium]|nr:hypothetical protein [Bacilli bacterium]